MQDQYLVSSHESFVDLSRSAAARATHWGKQECCRSERLALMHFRSKQLLQVR